MVVHAPEAEDDVEKEPDIWEKAFLDTNDPHVIKEYKIAERDRLYAENQLKKEAQKASVPETKVTEQQPPPVFEDIVLDDVTSVSELERFGMDHLKYLLQTRGLKCGGNLTERCKRLFSVKGMIRLIETASII